MVMKATLAEGADAGSPLGESVERSIGATLLAMLVFCLEWIGRTIQRNGTRQTGDVPELTYWRIQGWPF